MCLDDLDSSIEIPKYGYQVRPVHWDGQYRSICGMRLGRNYVGQVLSASELCPEYQLIYMDVVDDIMYYPNGFHVFVNYENAKVYPCGVSENIRRNCIWKVQIIHPLCTGYQEVYTVTAGYVYMPVVICKYTRIIDLDYKGRE